MAPSKGVLVTVPTLVSRSHSRTLALSSTAHATGLRQSIDQGCRRMVVGLDDVGPGIVLS
jgi:hypothetical protein